MWLALPLLFISVLAGVLFAPQALAAEADQSANQNAMQEFVATKAAGEQPVANLDAIENAPKQVGGVSSKYGLLMKDGKLYPCNKKGKKLGTYWKVGSTITYVFVAANVTKYTGKWKVRYKSSIKLSYPVSYKIKTINFLLKSGKNSVKTISKNAIDSTVTKVVNFNKTKVTSIGEAAFGNCAITKIALPTTLKTIGKDAFRSCSKLKTVSGLNKTKVTKIAAYAFAQSGIKSIAFPATLKTIGENAFRQAASLGTVKYLNKTKITTVAKDAFAETAVKSVVLPSTLKSLGEEAFAGCTKLKTVKLPANCTTLGKSAFYGCTALTSVSLPAKCTTLGNYAFYGCTALTSISLPANCTTLGESAFEGCTKLTSVSLPAKCTTLGNYAFYGCSSLATLTIAAPRVVPWSTRLLYGTKIYDMGTGVAIKVPANLVDKYQMADYWWNLANVIQAM